MTLSYADKWGKLHLGGEWEYGGEIEKVSL
jgi:hypothetical protein